MRPSITDTAPVPLGYKAKPLDASAALRDALSGEIPKPMLQIPYKVEGERPEGSEPVGKSIQPAAVVDAFKANTGSMSRPSLEQPALKLTA